MRIIKASFQNFKRIEVVEITPAGRIVEITGANGNGKTSVLDGIQVTLGGKKYNPKEPIRRGAESARVALILGEDGAPLLEVERRWNPDKLVVKSADGADYGAAQKKLDRFVDAFAFDPIGIMDLKGKEQRAKFLELLGVDMASIDARHAKVYLDRRDVNRDHKRALVLVGDPVEGAPDDPVDTADLQGKLKATYNQNVKNGIARRDAAQAQDDAARLATRCEEFEVEIDDIKAALEQAERNAASQSDRADEAKIEADKATEAAALLEDGSPDDLLKEIDQAQELNALYGESQSRIARQNYAEEVAQASLELTEELAAIEQERVEALAGAKMTVKGLGIAEDGVTYEGLPLEQAAWNRQIRICTELVAQANPELSLAMVRHGNDIDDDNLAEFYEVCEDLDIDVWVERRSGITAGALVIEAGRVAGEE